MALPLPSVIANVGPGGPIVSSMAGINALRKSMLENQYYAPNIESEIAQRNALASKLNTMTPLEAKQMQINNQYLPEHLRAANVFSNLQNQYYAPNIQSEIAQRNALASKLNTMTPLEAKELQLKNQFYPDLTKAQIQAYQTGRMGGGVAGQAEAIFRDTIHKDYPNLTPDQVYEASNVLKSGGDKLRDGTPIELSPNSMDALSNINMHNTSRPIVTNAIKAAQSHAEISALTNYAQEGLKPYGDTIAGYSPRQIIDSLKTDDESQERLGRFIASQQLNYEISQNQIRLAAGTPGLHATEELMNLGMQRVNSMYPRLSSKARIAAQNYFVEGLKKGLEARQTVNVGASNVYGSRPKIEYNKNNTAPKATLRYNPKTGDFEEIK